MKMVSTQSSGVFSNKKSVNTKIGGRSSKMHENYPNLLVPLEVYKKPHVTQPKMLSNLLHFRTPYVKILSSIGSHRPFSTGSHLLIKVVV